MYVPRYLKFRVLGILGIVILNVAHFARFILSPSYSPAICIYRRSIWSSMHISSAYVIIVALGHEAFNILTNSSPIKVNSHGDRMEP
jgi:hypothetical protein